MTEQIHLSESEQYELINGCCKTARWNSLLDIFLPVAIFLVYLISFFYFSAFFFYLYGLK